MTIEFFSYPFWVGFCLLLLVLLILWYKTRNLKQVIYSAFLGFYLLILLGLALFPMPGPTLHLRLPTRQFLKHALDSIELVPFSYGVLVDKNGILLTYHIVENIIAAVPFGFGVLYIAPKLEKRILWLAVGLGTCIELLQLGFILLLGVTYRSVDINDVLWNAVGVLVGYGIFRLTQWIFSKRNHATKVAT